MTQEELDKIYIDALLTPDQVSLLHESEQWDLPDDGFVYDHSTLFEGIEGFDEETDANLCESRLFPTKHSLNKRSMKEMTELVFLYCLALSVLVTDYRYAGPAGAYAKRTRAFPSFDGFKASGTDLYVAVACVRVNGRLKNHLKLNQQLLYGGLIFNLLEFKMFLDRISKMEINWSWHSSYLLRLERNLKISTSRYKTWRRMISTWEHLSFRQKITVATELHREMKRRWPMGELNPMLAKFSKVNRFIDFLTGAGAIVGALAGSARDRVQGKRATRKDNVKNKVGKVIKGAAAGWAFSRLMGK